MATKQKYKGFVIKRIVDDFGIIDEEKELVGYTYAISEKQAKNNIKFQLNKNKRKSNGYNYGSCEITKTIEVELIA